MKSIALVQNSLKWAFHTFADNLPLFLQLILISTGITLLSTALTFGLTLIIVPFYTTPYFINSALILTVLTLGLAPLVVPFYITLCFINGALILYDGKKINTIQQCLVGWEKFIKAFAALWIYGIAVTGGLLLLVIPGIYIASRYYYVVYCIMGDDTGIIESFQCSNRLTEKLPWHGLLLLCCATILGGVWFLLPIAALMNVYAYKYCKSTAS